MKRVLSLLLVLSLLFGLTGCVSQMVDPDDLIYILEELDQIVSEEYTEPTEPSLEVEEPQIPDEILEEPDVPEGPVAEEEPAIPDEPDEPTLDEHGSYTSKEEVALYLHLYGRLPENFMTKNEARKLGWEGGSLEPYAEGKCIGGDRFGNYEGLLPEVKGRTYYECDIDTLGAKSRGAKRIVFSNDGLVYYTADHYESFELLYGEAE